MGTQYFGPKARMIGVGAASFFTALAVGMADAISLPRLAVTWPHPSDQVQSIAAMDTGPELALVYIGSSACYWSNVDGLPSLIREVGAQLREQAQANGHHFASIGIARDRNVENGLRHLRKMGPFDEVMTGRGWMNIGVLKYVYEDLRGPAITPQVLVVRRQLYREETTGIRDEQVLVRKAGVAEIEAWIRQGVPVPGIAVPGATAPLEQ